MCVHITCLEKALENQCIIEHNIIMLREKALSESRDDVCTMNLNPAY